MSKESDEFEFYVPATFQFSTKAGEIERILVGLFKERGELEVRTFSEEESPDFYVPAVYQFSMEPGRIERFLQAVFDNRDEMEGQAVPEKFADFFYLPASNPDGYRRHVEQKSASLTPASEMSREREKPSED